MRRALLCLALLAPLPLLAQTATPPPSYTVATLPAASTMSGKLARVTDGSTATDCTVGGGTYLNTCRSNGTAWVQDAITPGATGGTDPNAVHTNVSTAQSMIGPLNFNFGTGAFANTAMGLNNTYSLNSLNFTTEFQDEQTTANYDTEAGSFGVAVPSTSTVYQADGLGAFINSASTTTNAVGGYFSARATAAGTSVWGINPLVSDGGGSHFAYGVEDDCNVTGTGTAGACLFINGIPGALTAYPAVEVNAAGAGHWSTGLQINNGAATYGIQDASAENCVGYTGACPTNWAWDVNGIVATQTTAKYPLYVRGSNSTSTAIYVQASGAGGHTFEVGSGASAYPGTFYFADLTSGVLATLTAGVVDSPVVNGWTWENLGSGTNNWINAPSSGIAGIGDGGSGTNAWIAHTDASGEFFTDAAAGDMVYRSTAGNSLLFGPAGGASTLQVHSTSIGVSGAVKLNTAQTTVTGTTAGTAVWSQPQQGTAIKQAVIYLSGYENTTATAQTITLPASFATVAYVVADGGSCAGVTISGATVTLPASMGAPQTGLCEVKGY